MGPLKDKKTVRPLGVPRRFKPSSEAPPGSVLTEVGESRNKVKGREPLGRLVAARRAELGLTQEDLAVRMNVSQATVAGIESDQRPSAETLRRLAKALLPEEGETVLLRSIQAELTRFMGSTLATAWFLGRSGTVPPIASAPVSREAARTPRGSLGGLRGSLGGLRGSLGGPWLWGSLAAAALVAIVVIVAARTSDSGGDPTPQPTQVVSAPPAAPVAVEKPQKAKKPHKAKKAQKAKEAAGTGAPATNNEESSAPAPTSSDNQSSSDAESEPVSAPVATPPPAPSSSHSNGPAPGIQHGIQIGGP